MAGCVCEWGGERKFKLPDIRNVGDRWGGIDISDDSLPIRFNQMISVVIDIQHPETKRKNTQLLDARALSNVHIFYIGTTVAGANNTTRCQAVVVVSYWHTGAPHTVPVNHRTRPTKYVHNNRPPNNK